MNIQLNGFLCSLELIIENTSVPIDVFGEISFKIINGHTCSYKFFPKSIDSIESIFNKQEIEEIQKFLKNEINDRCCSVCS